MQVETAWVGPPPQIGGLDHLAVQAPCNSVYGCMLTGITNVTDRSRRFRLRDIEAWIEVQKLEVRRDEGRR